MRAIRISILMAVLVGGAGPAELPAASLQFVSGTIVNVGSDTNCITLNSEIREQAYAGFSERNLKLPAPKEIWYAHVVISHPGDPCSGGSYTDIEIALPPNTAFAISADNPVFCAFRNTSKQVKVSYTQAQGCPQAPTAGAQVGYYDFPAYSGATPVPWPISWGTYFELMIPLVSSTPLTAQSLTFRINPDLGVLGYPTEGVFVSSDYIFRTDLENDAVYPDICLIAGTVYCGP